MWGRAPGGSLALKGTLLFLQEMASDELRELRNAMTQEAIREHQMAKTGGTTTDLFQCSKCKKKNCTYNQVWRGGGDQKELRDTPAGRRGYNARLRRGARLGSPAWCICGF